MADAEGINYLIGSDWPSLPSLAVSNADQAGDLRRFISENDDVEHWVLRSLDSVPHRYQKRSVVVRSDEVKQWLDHQPSKYADLFPFCLQPYLVAKSAGTFLLKDGRLLAEFVEGPSGQFLRGLVTPYKCVIGRRKDGRIGTGELESCQVTSPEMLLKDVLEAANVAPENELTDVKQKLLEWIIVECGRVYFVDCQIMPDEFLPDWTSIYSGPVVVYPGLDPSYPYKEASEAFLIDRGLLVSDMPRLGIMDLCVRQRPAGLYIKGGALLSHVSKFAAQNKLPCLFDVNS